MDNLENTGWAIAEGQTDDYEFQIRIRKFEQKIPTISYPQRLNIFWSMDEVFENGMPSEKELEKLHLFEDRIIEAVESDEFSIMSIVLTGNSISSGNQL
ncbi:MAG: DUF695 domain-containing protein [Desulfobulbaceae bacterium]|nr:DUF695 domain-containing protein [Desulfobulbaceae bacterium]